MPCSTKGTPRRGARSWCAGRSATRRSGWPGWWCATRRSIYRPPTLSPPSSLLHGARLETRVDALGNLLRLSEQDRAAWDQARLAAGFAHLERAGQGDRLSVYHLEAGIAAHHAAAPSFAATEWSAILELYDALLVKKPTPVVALNRAVALAMVAGPRAGLEALATLAGDPILAGYYPLPIARGELLALAGDTAEAVAAFTDALALEAPEPVQRYVREKLAALA
jgi:RNA polymerase sigma-70 factor (ECF subfamily)